MKLELLQKNCYYHIYNRGINSCKIFNCDENKSYFLKLLEKYLTGKTSIFAYCLMDNHFHLVIRVEESTKAVTQSFSNLFNAYAKAYNKQQNRTGSLFEKNFKRIKLHNEKYLKRLILYVHLNPKHHLGRNFKDFKFSSYPALINSKKTWLKSEEVIDLFNDLNNFAFCHNQYNDILIQKYAFE